MEKKNISLRIEINKYEKIKEISPGGNISSLINLIITNYLAEQEKKNLILAYQRAAQSKVINQEMKELEGTIEDDIEKI